MRPRARATCTSSALIGGKGGAGPSSLHNFTYETESPWLVHYKRSHWWKRRSWPKFASQLHTWDWEPVTCALQALSLVGKAELVQVRFTTSHMRLRACDPYISSALIGKKKGGAGPSSLHNFKHETESPRPLHFKRSHCWKRWSWSKFGAHTMLEGPTEWVCEWMQDGCQVSMDSDMASIGSCFMVTWTIIKNHLLEVGLTQNWETMALRTLTTIGLFYFIMYEVMLK